MPAACPAGNYPFPTKIAEITNVSSTLLVVESTSRESFYRVEDSTTYFRNPNPSGTLVNQGLLFTGHLGSGNFLFVDGHVKALKSKATILASEGGTGSVNMWKINQASFGNPDITNVRANLDAADNFWN